MDEERITFSFGANWQDFIEKSYSPERVEISKAHLLGFLGRSDLSGLHFLDVGSGSGLSSLAAFEAGASRVTSFDVDPLSVRTTRALRALKGEPSNWQVLEGSALDDRFISSLEPADVVYSWGVLHHTGAMWRAVANTARLIKPDGVFYLALYTTTHKSPHWIRVKKAYNEAGPAKKKLMELHHFLRHTVLVQLMARRNPISFIRQYKGSRGMAYWSDLRDWLGGYPYEDAKIEEVLEFGRNQLGLELMKLATGEACTEYLFQRRGSAAQAGAPSALP